MRRRFTYGLVSGLAAIGFNAPLNAQCELTQQVKITPADRTPGDLFGWHMDASGDRLVASAWQGEGPEAEDCGAVYVFRLSDNGTPHSPVDDFWLQEAKITASSPASGDQFGHNLAIDGEGIVVGAPTDVVDGVNSGSAQVFRFEGANWTQEALLVPSDARSGDSVGQFVSISGDHVIISAMFNATLGYNAGAAYIFRRDGGAWVQEAKLLASDGKAGDQFGGFVAIDGNAAAVTAGWADDRRGKAYVFRRNDNGTPTDPADDSWYEEARISALDGKPGDFLGGQAFDHEDMAEGLLVVGAIQADAPEAPDTGAAYVFRKEGMAWAQQGKLLAPDRAPGEQFGGAIAVEGGWVVVGKAQRGEAAYVYRLEDSFWKTWAKLTASDAMMGDHFGYSAAAALDWVFVGAPVDDGMSGSVYAFRVLSDCDENGVLDACEIGENPSRDGNGNGVLDDCENAPPVCSTAPVAAVTCQGEVTIVQLDGTGSTDPDHDPLRFRWSTECPSASFDDATSPTPTLTINTSIAARPISCSVVLTVADPSGLTSSCSTGIEVIPCIPVDFKPTACPNPLSVAEQGVVPVAILGTAEFDVTTVDPASVEILGIPPRRWSVEDVATPFVPFRAKTACMEDCTAEGPDGHLDLTLKFDAPSIVEVLKATSDRVCLVLPVHASTRSEYGDVRVVGEDVVWLLSKGKGQGAGIDPLEVYGFPFVRGDGNGDGAIDVSDAIHSLGHLFTGEGRRPTCLDALDANDDGAVDVSDPVSTLTSLFLGMPPALPPPHGACAFDPTPDLLRCEGVPICGG